LYAFTRIRALAKNLDTSPWEPQLHNHRRIVDAMRMGHPSLAEQVVVHVINLFLESALQVWAH
jgi:DNA-binding GntR family transcriptional regulator